MVDVWDNEASEAVFADGSPCPLSPLHKGDGRRGLELAIQFKAGDGLATPLITGH